MTRRAKLRAASLRLVMLILAVVSAALPVDRAVAQSPRVALVLGGGGAAGVAHVGVIRELERMGLRPDLVVGTSMGAVVGGLYASGFTPDDLERAVTEIDWTRILDDASDRELIHPLRRDSRLDPLSVSRELPVGVAQDGLQIAGALVDGVKLTLILRQLTLSATGVNDFDDLPIPFRAVATDLMRAEPVVLGEGDLSTALRASMSIPGFFPSVELNGRRLVDGGVTNNLPIDVARDLGADVVIASFIPPSNATAEDLDSITGTLSQSMAIFIHARSRALIGSLGKSDVLISPAVEDIGMLAFDLAPSTVAAGIDAVRARSDEIARIADQRPEPELRRSVGDTRVTSIAYDRIAVEYDGKMDPEMIRRRLGLAPSGVTTAKELELAVRRVHGLELFENVSYRIDTIEDETVITVLAVQRNDGLPQPHVALVLSNAFGEDSDFTIGLGLDIPEVNARGGRIDVAAAIGAIEGVLVRFDQPLDLDQYFFIRAESAYFEQRGQLFLGVDEPAAEIEVEQLSSGLTFLYSPGDWGGFGPQFEFARDTSRVNVGSIPGVNRDEDTSNRLLAGFVLDYDTLDDPDLPRSGIQLGAEFSVDLLDDAKETSFALDLIAAESLGPHTLSPFGTLQGALEPDTFSPNFIGGFQRLSGFEEGELVNNVVGVVGMRYYWRTDFVPFFGSEAFAGGSLEYGGAYEEFSRIGDPDGGFIAGSVFAGVQTLFGPAILGVGFAEQGQYSATFTLGSRF